MNDVKTASCGNHWLPSPKNTVGIRSRHLKHETPQAIGHDHGKAGSVPEECWMPSISLTSNCCSFGFQRLFPNHILTYHCRWICLVFVDGQLHNAIIGLGFVTLQNLQISMYKSIVYTNAKKKVAEKQNPTKTVAN